MSDNHSWVADTIIVVTLLTTVLGFLTAYVQYQDKLAEIELRVQANNRAQNAEKDAKREREARRKLERQQDSIRKFLVNYRAHLLRIGNASSQLREARASQIKDRIPQEKIQQLEDDLIVNVTTFTKFVNEWRIVHRTIRDLLDGNVDAMAAAVKARDVKMMERQREILERNVDDKQGILEEGIRTLE